MSRKSNSNLKKALLVIDIQEDYTGTTAKPPFPYKHSEALISAVNRLIEESCLKDIEVIYIRQQFEGLLGWLISKILAHGTAIKDAPGTEIDKRVSIISENVFSKPVGNALTNPELEKFLQERHIAELYLVGLDAQFCVYETAKAAIRLGYRVSIIKEGILMIDEKRWDKQLKRFENYGINLITSNDY